MAAASVSELYLDFCSLNHLSWMLELQTALLTSWFACGLTSDPVKTEADSSQLADDLKSECDEAVSPVTNTTCSTPTRFRMNSQRNSDRVLRPLTTIFSHVKPNIHHCFSNAPVPVNISTFIYQQVYV